MRKDYLVTCELNMCADRVETICVTTNSYVKAIKLAIKKFKDTGNFCVKAISCKEV